MKIVCISDTHNKHQEITIPECDVLLHAGDFSGHGSFYETKNFLDWYNVQPAKYKIFISGNHDFMDQDQPELFRQLLLEYPEIDYLRDSGIDIEGIRIWGRPWTPSFGNWAFMADPGSPKMHTSLGIIPTWTDILLTHGPSFKVLDKTARGERVGCLELRHQLRDRLRCRAVVFGHIHEDYGTHIVKDILHINASILDEYYRVMNQPIVFEMDKPVLDQNYKVVNRPIVRTV